MKFTLSLILSITCSLLLNAQIELNTDDYHRFDNQYFRGQIINNLSQIEFPASGQNQVWDYFLLQNDFKDTLSVIKVDLTPYADSFPNAEFALTSNFSKFFYESMSPQGSRIEGLTVTNPLDNQVKLTRYNFEGYALPYPIQFGDNYSFGYSFTEYLGPQGSIIPGNSDSLKINSFVEINISVDGYGSLTIPAGTFDVLRFKQHSEKTDSVYIYNENNVWEYSDTYFDSSETYLFYTKNIGSSLLTITERQGFITAATYLTGFVIDGIENMDKNDLNIYPQPANDFIAIESAVLLNHLTIQNLQGQTVYDKRINDKQISVDVHNIPPGLYIVSIRNKSNQITSTHKIIVTR